MTGRELIALIHELGAEDMTVCVGSEGYASVLAECKADEYTIVGDDESRTEGASSCMTPLGTTHRARHRSTNSRKNND